MENTESGGSETPNGLDEEGESEASRRSSPSSLIVFEAIRTEGERELQRPVQSLAWSGFAAGLSMGFSFLAEGFLHHHLPEAPWSPLISKLGYSIGFLIVILGRQQLFTENTLTPVLPLLHCASVRLFRRLGILWTTVLAANLAGGFLFALLLAWSPAFTTEPVFESFREVAFAAAEDPGWPAMFVRALFAGWLIALIIWLLPAAESARIWIIIILTTLIGLGGFPHIIAGSIEQYFLVLTGGGTWGQFAMAFFIPTLFGNITGGLAFVAALNYAQVRNEK